MLPDRVQTIPFDLGVALGASRSKVLLETILAVQLALLLHEAHVLEGPPAARSRADEVLRAPDLAESRDERAPVQNNSSHSERTLFQKFQSRISL